jgi:hypothetical protein
MPLNVCSFSLLLLISVTTASAAIAQSPALDVAAPPAAVRPLRPWIARLVTETSTKSATLRDLLARAATQRTIIYVEEADGCGEWDGRIRFAGAAGGYRYLRIELRHLDTPLAAAVLAHELQHAVEIVAAAVFTPEDFDALFQRIGFQTLGRMGTYYDTEAAVAAGTATLQELTGRPVAARTGYSRDRATGEGRPRSASHPR